MPDVYAMHEQFSFSIDGAVNVKFDAPKRRGLPKVQIQVPVPWVGNLRALVRQELFGMRVLPGNGEMTTEALQGFRSVRKQASTPIELRKENYDISVGRYRPMKTTLVLR